MLHSVPRMAIIQTRVNNAADLHLRQRDGYGSALRTLGRRRRRSLPLKGPTPNPVCYSRASFGELEVPTKRRGERLSMNNRDSMGVSLPQWPTRGENLPPENCIS